MDTSKNDDVRGNLSFYRFNLRGSPEQSIIFGCFELFFCSVILSEDIGFCFPNIYPVAWAGLFFVR